MPQTLWKGLLVISTSCLSKFFKPTKTTMDHARIANVSGDLSSKVECSARHGAHGAYVTTNAAPYLDADMGKKLKSLQGDIDSLKDYEMVLADKIHFLLDATLGLTNVEQNNIFRILTVVSVVGIPPTFFASMWGMNFKNIPEYDWSHGYQFGLCVIALSAIIPFVWFKRRGWW
jgi:magnesium transporter